MHHYNLSLFWTEVLKKNGDRPALAYSEQTIPYSQLGCIVERLADKLISLGLQRGDVVAIAHSKKTLSYALMLASLRIGLPYVCIDVDSPQKRNHKILETSDPSLLCFDNANVSEKMQSLAEKFNVSLFSYTKICCHHQYRTTGQHYRAQWLAKLMALVSHTLCSPQVPLEHQKELAVTHDNILHFIAWAQQRFRISPSDNFAESVLCTLIIPYSTFTVRFSLEPA